MFKIFLYYVFVVVTFKVLYVFFKNYVIFFIKWHNGCVIWYLVLRNEFSLSYILYVYIIIDVFRVRIMVRMHV